MHVSATHHRAREREKRKRSSAPRTAARGEERSCGANKIAGTSSLLWIFGAVEKDASPAMLPKYCNSYLETQIIYHLELHFRHCRRDSVQDLRANESHASARD